MLVLPLADRIPEDAQQVLALVRGGFARTVAPCDLPPAGVDADNLEVSGLTLPEHVVEDEIRRLHERLRGFQELRLPGNVLEHLELRRRTVDREDRRLVAVHERPLDVEVEPKLC